MDNDLAKDEKALYTVLFILGVFAGVIPVLTGGFHSPILTVTVFLIAFYFLISGSPVLLPSLFLLLLNLSFYLILIPSIWVFNLIAAIAVYLMLLYSGAIKREGFLKAGRLDNITVLWVLLIVLVSSSVLVAWTVLLKPDMAKYFKLIPDVNAGLIILGIAGFSVFNAVAEEFMFRGVLWDGFERLFNRVFSVVIIQAVFFGLCHYKGFPSGFMGVGLAFIYGVFLGFLRYRSGGLLAPITAHIFADFTISIIVLKAIGRI